MWGNPLVDVRASISVYNEGQIDDRELLLLQDKDCVVTVTRNEEVKFKGYLLPEGQSIQFRSTPYELTFQASTGVEYLEGMKFNIFGAELGTRCPLNYFRRILIHQLGIELPIRWSTSIEAINTDLTGDPFQKLRWSQYGDGIIIDNTTGLTEYKNCNYILDGLAKALQSRVVQADGAWWILGVNEQFKETLDYYECANATGLPVVTEHTRASVQHIGTDYEFINNDARLLANKACSKVHVLYNHDQFENILPNGGLDQWSTGLLMWWGVDNSELILSQHEDLTGRGGAAVSLLNVGSQERTFKLRNGLPIDGHTLYRNFEWGFSFMPKAGFPIDNTTGFIDWRNNEIKASIKYTVDNGGTIKDYYLNEHGYWGDENGPANQQVVGTSWSSSANTFNINFDQNKNFFEGDKVFIQFMRDGVLLGREVVFDETMDVDSGTEYIVTQIQDGFTSSPNAWTVSINNTQNDPSNNKAWTEKEPNYFKYVKFSVNKLEIDNAASIQYQGAGSLENKIIDPGKIDISTIDGVGRLDISFYVKPGQEIVFDDIWMKVNPNRDLYNATVIGSDNTASKELELSISSSFNGFMKSNFMKEYSTSDKDWKFTDGLKTGSLTELYARSVLRCVYLPRYVFDGSISTRGKDWSFLDNYTIQGLDGKFLPTAPVYNTSKNEVTLRVIQHRNDDIEMEIEHLGV